MSQSNTGVIGGRGDITIEKISLKSQVLGIVVPWVVMIAQRVLFCLVIFLCVLMAGEHVSTWILGLVALNFWDSQRIGRPVISRAIPILLFGALALGLLASFDYWPTLIQWGRIDTRMSYRVRWGETWTWWLLPRLSLDTGWLLASQGVVLLRALSILLFPAIILKPALLADWAIGTELALPQWRGLRPGLADPASVPMPSGYNVQGNQRSPQPEDKAEPEIVVIPQPRRRGGA